MKTLEEIAEEFLIRQGCQRMCCNDPECNGVGDFFEDVQPKDLIEFAKWQAEKMYSEEDMKLAFETGRNFQLTGEDNFNELIEQFKKK
jgi:hypothetical protein